MMKQKIRLILLISILSSLTACSSFNSEVKSIPSSFGNLIVFDKNQTIPEKRRYPNGNEAFLTTNKKYKNTLQPVIMAKNDQQSQPLPKEKSGSFSRLFSNKKEESVALQEAKIITASPKPINEVKTAAPKVQPKPLPPVKESYPKLSNVPAKPQKFSDPAKLKKDMEQDINNIQKEIKSNKLLGKIEVKQPNPVTNAAATPLFKLTKDAPNPIVIEHKPFIINEASNKDIDKRMGITSTTSPLSKLSKLWVRNAKKHVRKNFTRSPKSKNLLAPSRYKHLRED